MQNRLTGKLIDKLSERHAGRLTKQIHETDLQADLQNRLTKCTGKGRDRLIRTLVIAAFSHVEAFDLAGGA